MKVPQEFAGYCNDDEKEKVMKENLEPKGEKTVAINPKTIVFTSALVILGLAATSFFSSVGLELTNAADDVSVGVGFTLLGGIALAWLYVGLRVYNKFFGVTGE